MHTLLALALGMVLSATSLFAGDLTITSQVTGKGAMAKDGSQVQYLSATRMRVNHAGAKVDSLVDYGHEVIYSIDHAKKVITKFTFKDMQETMQALEDQMAGMPEMVTKMMFGDVSEVKVEQLGADTVLGRPCKKVRITLGKMVEELSIDPSLQFPIKDYAHSMTMLNRAPGPMGTLFKRVYQETAKLKGVPLRTHITGLMGMDVTTVATEVSTTAIPESAWALPAGYTMKDGGKEMKDAVKSKH
ncbi:DUF4412 domain-containing protein [Geothrix edaphica]|uniref:DUF4412 domain-containing protein n=1 Tax=Geothrix edaphica TaxID=2927976 RepID=A0ABQ5PY74_9BACT|nr:DUF4412 domain-containing protein [Geothrix edaphica]GLH67321.1 hypothetical protein GETHED_16850 [Geothrix edaphica]